MAITAAQDKSDTWKEDEYEVVCLRLLPLGHNEYTLSDCIEKGDDEWTNLHDVDEERCVATQLDGQHRLR